MHDYTKDFFNLVDDDITIDKVEMIDNVVHVYITKIISPHFCPVCGARMFSKGIYTRTLNHPILQDGREVTLHVAKRKWKCSSMFCGFMTSDSFKLFQAYKHSTNILPVLILKEMKSLTVTAEDIAARLNVSPTTVHYTFLQYVYMKRLPLSEVISIDEVNLNFDYRHKYPMIILDFLTDQPIDILPSRREYDTSKYFHAIPSEERDNVKYLICDMYNPYINYVKRYFPNAKAVVDCFHVAQWLSTKLNNYVNQVKRKYREIDDQRLKDKNDRTNRDHRSIKKSDELYIIDKFRWTLLKNKDDIDYDSPRSYDYFLKQYLDNFQREKLFFDLDKNFPAFRDLKELYVTFNKQAMTSPDKAPELLDNLISKYNDSGVSLFVEFSSLLARFRDQIITSYTYVSVTDINGNKTVRRLSNALIESFNNYPKDLKRSSNGVSSFEYTRNRILWATRKDPSMLAIPRKIDDLIVPHPKRGSYSKK